MRNLLAICTAVLVGTILFAGCKTENPVGPTFDLKLTYPNGGEVLHPGDSITITWEEAGTISGVMVWVSTNDQFSFGNGVANDIPLNGSTQVPAGQKKLGWKIPLNVQTGSSCWIWIHDYLDATKQDFTDATFAIQ